PSTTADGEQEQSTLIRESDRPAGPDEQARSATSPAESPSGTTSANGTSPNGQGPQPQGSDQTVLAPPAARPAGTGHLPNPQQGQQQPQQGQQHQQHQQPYQGARAYPDQTGGSGQAPPPYRG